MNFLIRKGYDFFRNIYSQEDLSNIYSQEDLSKSKNLKDLKSYYFAFKKCLNIIIFMEDAWKDSMDFNNIIDHDLKIFWWNFALITLTISAV